MGSFSCSTISSCLLARRRSPSGVTYTQVRSRTAVTVTTWPARTAWKPSSSISSSASCTSLSGMATGVSPLEDLAPHPLHPLDRGSERAGARGHGCWDHRRPDHLGDGPVGHPAGIDVEPAEVDAPLLDDQGADLGIALQPAAGGDLEAAVHQDVALDAAGDDQVVRLQVRPDHGLGADQQLARARDVALH